MIKLNYKTIILLSLIVIFITGYGIGMYRKGGDLHVFLLGSQRLLSKSVITVAERHHFAYPPFFAILMIPLSVLPVPAANILWYLITWACLFGSILMIRNLIFQTDKFNLMPNRKRNWVMFWGFLISMKYILSVFENEQFDLLVFFFCIAGLYYVFKNKEILGSCFLAAAISIKCTPVLFLFYFIIKKRWKTVIFSTIFVTIFSFLPDIFFCNHKFSYFFDWFSKIVFYNPLLAGLVESGFDGISLAPGVGTNFLNQSLGVLIYRIFSENAVNLNINMFQLSDNIVTIIKSIIFGIILGGPLFLLRKRIFNKLEKIEFPFFIETASIFVLMLLFSPMSSKAHFNTLIYANTLLVALYALNKNKKLLYTIIFLIFFLQFTGRDLIGNTIARFLYQFGITTFSTLITYFGLIWSYNRFYILSDKR